MKRTWTRLFSFLLATVMLLSLFPASALGAEGDELTIKGYSRITELPSGGLEDGDYLFVAPYNGAYYMLYPGGVHAGDGTVVNNAAKLVVGADGAATGYRVRSGSSTLYADSVAVSTDFSIAENHVTYDANNNTSYPYSATATQAGGSATYYLCPVGVTGAGGALYQTSPATSAFSITLSNGYFNLKHNVNSVLMFYSTHMNFNQGGGGSNNFLIFKRNELHFDGYSRVTQLPEDGLETGKYLFVVPYDGNYYMPYPGVQSGGPNVNNSARLVLDATGKATGYKVGSGTAYDAAEIQDFKAVENFVAKTGSKTEGSNVRDLYTVGANKAGAADSTTWYLSGHQALYNDTGSPHDTNSSPFTGAGNLLITVGDAAGQFKLHSNKDATGSYLMFNLPHMNFNQSTSPGTNPHNFMIFKSNAPELTIEGYERVCAMPSADGLEEGDYLIVAPYDGNYYMLYPGATGADADADNAARLVVDADGVASGYKVGHGNTYDAAAENRDFRLAENHIEKNTTTSTSTATKYSVTAAGGYKLLCDGREAPVYQTSGDSSMAITAQATGTFRFSGTSLLDFYSTNMNFNQGGAGATLFPNMMLFKRLPVVPGSKLSKMLTGDQIGGGETPDADPDGQNSWAFTGGRSAQGSFADIAGARTYAGHFEEYIRYTNAKALQPSGESTTPYFQRHVINAAYEGQTLAQIVESFDTRIAPLKPQAVTYLVEPGDSAEADFADNLNVLIENALALRDGTGMLVIATLTDADQTAVDEVVTDLGDAVKPYVLPVRFSLTDDQKTAAGFPNALGHFAMAQQLTDAVSGATVSTAANWPYGAINDSVMAANFPTKRTVEPSHGYEEPTTFSDPQQAIQDKMEDADKDYMTWLFMGDSITHGAAWTGGFDTISQSFEKFLKDDLGRKEDVVINAGSSGATTASTINDLNRRLVKYSPDVVVLMLGTNDTSNNVSETDFKANIRALLDAILAKGAVPVLRTPPPTSSNSYANLGNYAGWMQEVAAEEDYADLVILVDQYTHWAGAANWSSVFSRNSVHPDEVGQLWMTHQLIHELALWKEDASICNLEYAVMAAPTPPTVPDGADVKEDWRTDLRPASGTTQGQPFPAEGLAGGNFYRIPSIVTVKGSADASLNGTLVAVTDMRWKQHQDSSNIDSVVSWSSDDGATWNYSFVNFFGDVALTAAANKSAIFIDPMLTADDSGNLYLLVNAFPAGVATHGSSYQDPEFTTGFAEIDGVQRMTVYTMPDNSNKNGANHQTNTNYSYYIGDFAPISGSSTKYAPILSAEDHTDSGFYTDDYFYLYYTATGTKNPANDKIYCLQMGGGNSTTTTWVQQNLFFYNATLHVRNAQFLYMVKSTDGGRTWSTPTILNDQVRTGQHKFYGPGPGGGICLDDGTIIVPTYTLDEHSSFIYSADGGESWNRGPVLAWESTENMIVQIDSDTIRQFYRNRNHDLYYADYTRSNGVWTAPNAPVFTGQQKQGNNQLSAIRYTGKIEGKDIILVSTASNTAVSASGYARKGGKVIVFCLNDDKTMTYLSTYRINDPTDWYGYSSLTQLTNGDVGIIYENSQVDGNDTNNPGYCGLTYFSLSSDTLVSLVRHGLLEALVRQAEALSADNYSDDSWSPFAQALTDAQAVTNNETASAAEIKAATDDLQAAMDALELIPVVISGTVTDESGAAVVNATVTLEDASYYPVGRTATTDASGLFAFRSTEDHILAVAQYQLKVEATGYEVNTFSAGTITKAQPTSDTTCALVAEAPGAYVNNFDSGDVSMLHGATGDAVVAALTLVDDATGGKAVKISGLVTGETPIHVLDHSAPQIKNGTVEMDITLLGNASNRFGLALRANGTGNRVWIGHFEGSSTDWNWQSYTGSFGSFGAGPLLMNNATRHVKVEMNETAMTLWVDGIRVGQATGMNALNVAGYIGLSSTRSAAQYIVDNIRVVSADTPAAGTYTVAGAVTTADDAPMAGAAIKVYLGDALVTATATNAAGAYQTQPLAAGTYTVKVSASGYPEKTGEITVSDANLSDQNFVLAADKTALQAAYDAVKDLTNDNYTDESWAAFDEARAAAESLLEDVIAKQDAVDAALAALNAAKDALAKTPTSSDPSSSGTTPRPSKPTTTTTTSKNEDGSTTTTVTNNRTGTVTETTEKADGTVEVKETLKDGTVTETVKNTDGSTEVVETKPDGTVTAATTDPEGGKVEKVTDPEKNVAITVTDPTGETVAEVKLPAVIPEPETKFEDVPADHWAEKAINTVAGLGLVKGVGEDRYDMTTAMDRGSLATVLYRLSNGKSGYEAGFRDVPTGKYYTEGVAWAAKVGVVTGISADVFAPEQVITREQLAVMLARYAKLMGMDTKADAGALKSFADSSATGDWAVDGVAWCVKTGILRGKGGNVLDPTADVSRAEVAVMLERFVELMK